MKNENFEIRGHSFAGCCRQRSRRERRSNSVRRFGQDAAPNGKVTVVEIGAHFVSAIRLTEPVNSIAVGDPALFQVEHSEREPELVLVKALTERSAETNLLVSTIHGRQFSFLLVNRGSAAASTKVDFLLQYKPAASFLVEPEIVPFPLIGQTATIEQSGAAASTTAKANAKAERPSELCQLH